MMPKYGGVEKCPACLKSVYPMEKVDSLWFCTSCFEVFDLVYNVATNTRSKDEEKRVNFLDLGPEPMKLQNKLLQYVVTQNMCH